MAKDTNKRTRILLIIAAAILFGVLLYANRRILGETWLLLTDIRIEYLLLLPVIQFFNYSSVAMYYRTFFKNLGIKTPLFRMIKMVYALEFVNQILPSGGLSGVTYFIYGMKHKIAAGTVTLAQIGRYLFSYLTYFGLFAVALGFLLYGSNQINPRVYEYLVAFVILAIVGIVSIVYFISSKARTSKVIGNIGRFLNWISERLRSGKSLFGSNTIEKSLNDFHESFMQVKHNWRQFFVPFIFMGFNTFFGALTVIVSFYAIDVPLNPGAILFSFAVANAAGVLSVVPGDIGVHETVMIAMLTLVGAPASAALSATLLYRVFNKFVFMPFGFYCYSQLLKPARGKT